MYVLRTWLLMVRKNWGQVAMKSVMYKLGSLLCAFFCKVFIVLAAFTDLDFLWFVWCGCVWWINFFMFPASPSVSWFASSLYRPKPSHPRFRSSRSYTRRGGPGPGTRTAWQGAWPWRACFPCRLACPGGNKRHLEFSCRRWWTVEWCPHHAPQSVNNWQTGLWKSTRGNVRRDCSGTTYWQRNTSFSSAMELYLKPKKKCSAKSYVFEVTPPRLWRNAQFCYSQGTHLNLWDICFSEEIFSKKLYKLHKNIL